MELEVIMQRDFEEKNRFKLGWNTHSRNFKGTQIGHSNFAYNSTPEQEITQIALAYNFAYSFEGSQLSLSLNFADYFIGKQIGFINKAGYFDSGYIEGIPRIRSTGSGETSEGTQIGFGNILDNLEGTQIGLVNHVKESLNGHQFGLICSGPEEGDYVQFGLLTYRQGNLPWYKRFSPFVGRRSNG